MDQTSLIWATFLRSGYMHCGTGRPASQRVASNHLKLPETAWNSLLAFGSNTPTICHDLPSPNDKYKKTSWHLRSCWVGSLKRWPRHELEGYRSQRWSVLFLGPVTQRLVYCSARPSAHFGPPCFVGSIIYWSFCLSGIWKLLKSLSRKVSMKLGLRWPGNAWDMSQGLTVTFKSKQFP